MPSRVELTERAESLLGQLVQEYGPLMFHQSGGCCDGSAPMCYPLGEFVIGDVDVLLETLRLEALRPESGHEVPFYMSRSQFDLWKHTQLTVDVVVGRGSGFSVEAPHGVRFLIRSRVFSDDEVAALAGSRPA